MKKIKSANVLKELLTDKILKPKIIGRYFVVVSNEDNSILEGSNGPEIYEKSTQAKKGCPYPIDMGLARIEPCEIVIKSLEEPK